MNWIGIGARISQDGTAGQETKQMEKSVQSQREPWHEKHPEARVQQALEGDEVSCLVGSV
jgi:hypothetical protein